MNIHNKIQSIIDTHPSPAPKIELIGWWWKKYFKTYITRQEVMQDILNYDWEHGGREKHDKELKNNIKEMLYNQGKSYEKAICDNFNNGFKV